MNVKIFENREAQSAFVRFSEAMNPEQKRWFSKEVNSLFMDKSISEDGEYDCFRVTKEDVFHLATCVAVNVPAHA